VAHTCNPSSSEAEIGSIEVRDPQIVHETPISKKHPEQNVGGVAQVVGHLLCKCKVLSTNPEPRKKEVCVCFHQKPIETMIYVG
jgi:hypothetical protein